MTVKKIAKEAFEKTAIYTVEIPETVEEIEPYAFDDVPLLYNVINKTGKTFNWGTATMVSGDYDSSYYSFFKITTERVSYDLSNIFTINGLDLTEMSLESIYVNDTKTFDLYTNIPIWSENGLLVVGYDESVKLKNHDTLAFKGIIDVANNNVDYSLDKLKPNDEYMILPLYNATTDVVEYNLEIKQGSDLLYSFAFWIFM